MAAWLLAAAAGASPALAADPPAPAAFERLDLDGDGVISAEEFVRAGEARIEGMDADRDGAISQTEFLAFHEGQAKARVDRWLATLDRNRNGRLDGAELRGEQARQLLRCDANKDGTLTRDDLMQCQRRIARIWMKRIFAAYDKNGDERIDGEERLATQRQRFAKLDADSDGRITRAEFAAAYQRWSERRSAPAAPPTGKAGAPPSEFDELE